MVMNQMIKGVLILKEDIRLFKYLHAVKIATYDQIKRDVYPHLKYKSICNRLNKLDNNDLIWGYRDRRFENKKFISLTKKGFKEFVSDGGESRIELKSQAVKHDITLVDIRHSFLRSPQTTKYYTENQIQTWGDSLDYGKYTHIKSLNSDAVAKISFPNGDYIIPIEYESHRKYESQAEHVIREYYSCIDVPIVLYICSTNKVVNHLKYLEKSLYKEARPKLFFKLINEIYSDETLSFKNRNSEVLSFGIHSTEEKV